jgi:Flp pilus assembly pilin Flp
MRATTELQPTFNHTSPVEGRYEHMTLNDWFAMLRAHAQREEGQTMAEYGVVLAVITLGVITVITGLALAISGKLGAVSGLISGAGS